MSNRRTGRGRELRCISENRDRFRRRSNNSPEGWRRACRSTIVPSGGASKQRQERSAAWECPRDRRRSNRRSPTMPRQRRGIRKGVSMLGGSGAMSSLARRQRQWRGQDYKRCGGTPKSGWHRRGVRGREQAGAGEEMTWEKNTRQLVIVKYFVLKSKFIVRGQWRIWRASETGASNGVAGTRSCCYSEGPMTKRTRLDAVVERAAEIIEGHLSSLPPAQAKSMRKEIHALAVKPSHSARRGKGSRSPKSAGPRLLSRASVKSS